MLWVQQKQEDAELDFQKVHGKENPADVFTKFLSRPEIMGHLRRMSMVCGEGRHHLAPVRTGTAPCLKAAKFEDNDNEELQFVDGAMLVNDEGPSGLGGGA